MLFGRECYPYKTLESLEFKRAKCKFCGKYFWSKKSRDFCDDDECRVKAGLLRYGFIGNPVGKKHSYTGSWDTWVKIFKKFGHKPIDRYPVLARWRDDEYFVEASINDFQPHVVSGEVEPPANPLIIPQFCLRFNDLENVGRTGRHYSGFVMVGQHIFNYPHKFIAFKDEEIRFIHELLTSGFKIPEEEIFYIEDQWEGGGNAGPCVEFFVRGLELGNQVFMQFKKVDRRLEDLDTKVIDMGAGLERFPWLTQGTRTSYEVVYPDTLKYLKRFNLESREKVVLTDFTRALFVALVDGALPSNVSGGYNLRKILRECFSILRKNSLNLDLTELMKLHARELNFYPDLRKADFSLIKDILNEEHRKYRETIKNAKKTIEKTNEFDEKTLKQLYESQGITPEIIKEVKPDVEIPNEIYEIRKKEKRKKESQKKVFDLRGIPETNKLYYEKKTRAAARVLKVIDDYIVLDATVFYPRSGGQDCDLGCINNFEVLDVIKQEGIVLHRIKSLEKGLNEGDWVEMVVDEERRKQLTQHHTAAHIINGAARNVLGRHAQQAGAEKKTDKAHLDIFHYKKITDEEIENIEELSNKIIKEGRVVSVFWMDRTRAEQKYGFEIYQGGAVPGKEIRLVEIKDWDTEACGGLHLENTKDTELIIITKAKKIQDAVLRFEFLAGKAARDYVEKTESVLKESADILNTDEEKVYEKAKELFERWKREIKK